MKRGAERIKDRRTMDAILQMKREEKKIWAVAGGSEKRREITPGGTRKIFEKEPKENIIRGHVKSRVAKEKLRRQKFSIEFLHFFVRETLLIF